MKLQLVILSVLVVFSNAADIACKKGENIAKASDLTTCTTDASAVPEDEVCFGPKIPADKTGANSTANYGCGKCPDSDDGCETCTTVDCNVFVAPQYIIQCATSATAFEKCEPAVEASLKCFRVKADYDGDEVGLKDVFGGCGSCPTVTDDDDKKFCGTEQECNYNKCNPSAASGVFASLTLLLAALAYSM